MLLLEAVILTVDGRNLFWIWNLIYLIPSRSCEMKNNFRSFILIFFTSILLFSCSQKNNNIDLDLSNLPKPKTIKITDELDQDLDNEDDQFFIKDLIPFEAKEKVLSKFKIGKKDPFAEGDTQFNEFSTNFELTGFLNTEVKEYVFVKYLENEGIISEDSIGGINTEFLPDGAKVISIDTKNKQLKINFDNEDFIFEL